MVTGAEIAGGFAALKAVKDLLAGALDAKVDQEVKPKINEAMDKLGKAQDTMYELRAQNMELLEETGRLKLDIAEAKGWQAKLDAYALVKAPGGAVVYQYQAEPMHYICPSCLNKREIQILQALNSDSGGYVCKGCQAYFDVDRQTYRDVDRDPPDWRTA